MRVTFSAIAKVYLTFGRAEEKNRSSNFEKMLHQVGRHVRCKGFVLPILRTFQCFHQIVTLETIDQHSIGRGTC